LFVGRYGYPRISIGPLASPVALPMAERLESPSYLYGLSLDRVYSIRSSLLRGRHRMNVKAAKADPLQGSEPIYLLERCAPPITRRVLDGVQEMALSSRSVDTEMRSRKDLSTLAGSASLDMITMPMGPSLDMESLKLIGDVNVPNPVQRMASDTDVLAVDGVMELYTSRIGCEHISRLFSVGLLGRGKGRRLVPTRWSITAVDDSVSKRLVHKVMAESPLDGYRLHRSSAFGNHFLVALFPPPFRFEMQEQWQKGSLWGEGDVVHDWEGPLGRKDYASGITGAYYAARLAIAEHLLAIRRCAGASVIRWITDEYWAPLGVWVIREAVRKALEAPPLVFNEREELVKAMDRISGIPDWRKRSKHLSRSIDLTLERFI